MATGVRSARRAATWSAPWPWWLLGAAVLALGVGPALVEALDVPAWQRNVDLEVYRAAGVSLLTGRPLYSYVTDVPNLLPFTYPPFAALVALPLGLVPFGVAQALWAALQVALVVVICAVSARPLLARCGPAAPVVLAALASAACWMLPVSDGLFFGQVGILLTTLCLLDNAVRGRWPQGLLVGLSAALKLTPGLFLVHLWLAGRWRAAFVALAAAAGATTGAALVLPQESVAYWGTALFDTERIGVTAGTYNGSITGLGARLGPDGAAGSLLWAAVTVVVAVYGLWVAARAARAGEDVAAVAVVGVLTVLLSPVAWLHHLVWVVPGLLALAGDARSRVRVGAAVAVWALFSTPLDLPWRGARLLYDPDVPQAWARLLQSSYTAGSVLLIVALHLLVVRPARRRAGPGDGSATAVVEKCAAGADVR
ncbi:glycosyltransferase 87 family protein [Motilibacter aurantiacus]|uniref:glycosyltransferase 87 family protein n=1 Tax=Motilibacter aurantiacus TaxID=2714955 RepID=UPI00140CE6A4|nr:glycosyltransferase 87 family protein [Motilibacter aurantiacus]NHC46335.1 DUF2029 domain-containing protein [Motilibacter aurantiacus]